jgi:hypothetical protein
MKSKFLFPTLFLLWFVMLLAMFFIVQKPNFPIIFDGLINLGASLLLGFFFFSVSVALGSWILSKIHRTESPFQRLSFSFGIGMGIMGIAGFLLAAAGMAMGWISFLALTVVFLYFFSTKRFFLLLSDLRDVYTMVSRTVGNSPRWIPFFAICFFSLACLSSLAPPVEAFDGLFYHLTVPSLWIRDGGLHLVNIPHYWFPSLMEGMFVFPLSLGFDAVPQLIHLSFATMTCLLIWGMTWQLFDSQSAWWSLAIFLSMPSLPWLASWAYTDFGLIFYCLLSVVALLNWHQTDKETWLWISGGMAGFALGIKYTSFALPLVILSFVIIWGRKAGNRMWTLLLGFIFMSILTGGVWYLRNLFWTGNPVYPFIFGGPFWDDFRSQWYSGVGTGIGWDVPKLITLPFVAMLGYQDQNFFDGRFGPLFLVLLPLGGYVLWRAWQERWKNLSAVLVFFVLGLVFIIFWIFGVINTMHLFQSRLLWPGLILWIPILAAGVGTIMRLDMPKFRISYVFSTIVGIMVFIFLLDYSLLVFVRNPLNVALGLESRTSYMSRMQQVYIQAVNLVNKTPETSYVYLLNEPRTYGMERRIQPDPINDNLAHDFYIYSTNLELLKGWQKLGYTHVLAMRHVFSNNDASVVSTSDVTRRLHLQSMLVVVAETENYILFEIP